MNSGLPHYVAINQTPENGCEIQTACCGTSSIMMALRIVEARAKGHVDFAESLGTTGTSHLC
jgi:hypothetical protein